MVVFQALTWEARDDEDNGHLISVFGKTEDGRSVCVTTEFTPYFYVKLPDAKAQTVREVYHALEKRCPECLVGYGLKKAKDVWGFQNNQEFPFMRLDCANLAKRRYLANTLKYGVQLARGNTKLRAYEANLDPVLRMMHRTGIQSTGWLDTGGKCVRSHLAHVDIDLFCNDWTTLTPVLRDDIAPFVVASVDIECNSSTGKFPDADVTDDCCFQIALTLCKFGSDEPYEEVCLCYKKTEGEKVQSFDTEKALLEGCQRYLRKADVDIITGWNIFGFDLEYIMKRGLVCKCAPEFFEMGKFKHTPCEMLYKKLSSSALGDNELKLLPMSGRFIFDLFHEVKKGYKLDSYKLNSVAQLYLGDQKLDMPPREIFRRFQGGDARELGEVAEYCIKDTLLPHKLLAKLCILVNLLEMAKATSVPLCFLVERGQQIKVFSQLCKKAADLGFLVPVIYQGALPEEGYEGATVLEAQSGAYYTPITALDFASLYPSIMMAHNLCYSTLVMDERRYGNIPGVEYETFTLASGKSYKFAQNVPSLLPTILAELKQFRKQAKKDMATATTQGMKEVYNGKQLAYKISMNSCYGFTGAARGMLPCVAIASSVTFKGRSMIEETKNYVEANFPGANVRYGDSVTPDSALLIRHNGIVRTTRIDALVSTYATRSDGKEFSDVHGIEVWSDTGFTEIKQVIRHKTDKPIYRVLTHTGIADVTEDHSLLSVDKQEMKPTDVAVGVELLHHDCGLAFEAEIKTDITTEEAKAMGFFLGDVDVVPPSILNAPLDIVKAFWDGYSSSGGNIKSKEGSLGLCFLSRRLGHDICPSDISNPLAIKKIEHLGNTSDYVYDLTTESHHFHVGPGHMIVHNTDSVMVEFDVQGRTGQDAIDYSWTLGEKAAEECTRLFKKPNDLELEKVYMPYILYSKKRYAAKLWEKGKSGKVEFKYIDVKGLQLVRRDNTPHVREVCKELLDVILESSEPEPPQVLARERALELLTGDVPHPKLILSQSLSDTYKVKGTPVSIKDIDRSWDISMGHVQVHNKMRQRKPGSEPQSGDRVPYLLTKTEDPKARAFEKAEDPVYVEENNIPVDYHYYFLNKFLNPVCDLLEPLVPEPKKTIFGEIIEKNKPPKKKRAPAKQKTTITQLFKNFELSKNNGGHKSEDCEDHRG